MLDSLVAIHFGPQDFKGKIRKIARLSSMEFINTKLKCSTCHWRQNGYMYINTVLWKKLYSELIISKDKRTCLKGYSSAAAITISMNK